MSAFAADRTTSPDGRDAVFVVRGRMFVEHLATHKRVSVGRGLPIPCCELAADIANMGLDAVVELHDGAFWTKPDVAWAKGRRLVLVRAGDTSWFLSMDGKLRGDV
jgi:hypothetical protein